MRSADATVRLADLGAFLTRKGDRSGFDGPWTFSPITVTNDFFKLLFDETWVWKKWEGPKQFEDKKTRSLMMLP